MKLAMKGTSLQADPHFTPEDDWKLWPCSREAWAQYMLMPGMILLIVFMCKDATCKQGNFFHKSL